MGTESEFDVVVVGAGTAGAATAAFQAEAGRRVALVERRAFDEGGARWINAVPAWMFDRAGVARPGPGERHGIFGTASFRSAMDQASLDIQGVPCWDVDMRGLGDRLRRRAVDAGVTVFDHASPAGLEQRDGRPRSLELTISPPKRGRRSQRLSAALFVDATGSAGALRTLVDELRLDCPAVATRDLCSAASGLHEIRDKDAARRFLDRHHLEPGKSVSWMGLEGGFSTVIVTIEDDLETVSLVTGTIADGVHLSGPALLTKTRESYPWIGPKRFGGDALIPLRRPYDRLTSTGAALVGDAGCQVFSAHGSGIGNGLIAARLLAEATDGADDPGDHRVLWRYQAGYHRERGSQSAPFDVFRRLSQTWRPQNMEDLLAAGVLSPALWSEGILQRLAPPDPDSVLRGIRAVPRHSGVLASVAPHIARMYAVQALYRRYPLAPDLRRLRIWSRAAGALFGERSDLRSR